MLNNFASQLNVFYFKDVDQDINAKTDVCNEINQIKAAPISILKSSALTHL